MSESAVPARASAAPAAGEAPFDVEADVVVVGGGGGGLPAALFTRWLGDEVVLLEKAPELGGTAQKAAFWYWVPNNEPMRGARHQGPQGGLPPLHARGCRARRPTTPTARRSASANGSTRPVRAIYDNASPAAELLAERGALPYRHCDCVPDYWAELPEDKAPNGRVLVPRTPASRCPTAARWRSAP